MARACYLATLGDRVLGKRSSSAHGADDELADGLALSQRRCVEHCAPEDSYVDGQGARYAQQSFAARVPQTSPLVSFVRLTIDTRRAAASITRVRFVPSVARRSLSYAVRRGATRTVYVGWSSYSRPGRPLPLDEAVYDTARQSLVDYWERRLAEGATYVVPEKRVNDAQRNS